MNKYFFLVIILISSCSLPTEKENTDGIWTIITKYDVENCDSCITFFKHDTILYSYTCYKNHLEILEKEFYNDGQLRRHKELQKNDIFSTQSFWNNGNLMGVSYNTIKGTEVGLYKLFHENGALNIQGEYPSVSANLDTFSLKTKNFETGVLLYRQEKEGFWSYFNEKEELVLQKKFIHGKVVEEIIFD